MGGRAGRDHRAASQGGVNPDLPLDYYLEIVRETVRRFPGVTPHFWSAVEIQGMAEVSGKPLAGVLEALWDAGQRTIPGGGAEVLVAARPEEAGRPQGRDPRPGSRSTRRRTRSASAPRPR